MGREEALAVGIWVKGWCNRTVGGRVAHSLTPLVHIQL
jgi:hypothetical protein